MNLLICHWSSHGTVLWPYEPIHGFHVAKHGLFQQNNMLNDQIQVAQNWFKENLGNFQHMTDVYTTWAQIKHLWNIVKWSVHMQDPAASKIRDKDQDSISQQLSWGLLTTYEIDAMLLHFTRLERVLHDARHLSHDFWQVILYVYVYREMVK